MSSTQLRQLRVSLTATLPYPYHLQDPFVFHCFIRCFTHLWVCPSERLLWALGLCPPAPSPQSPPPHPTLVQAMPAWLVKTRRAPSRHSMRGSMVIRLRPCTNRAHPPPPPPRNAFGSDEQVSAGKREGGMVPHGVPECGRGRIPFFFSLRRCLPRQRGQPSPAEHVCRPLRAQVGDDPCALAGGGGGDVEWGSRALFKQGPFLE